MRGATRCLKNFSAASDENARIAQEDMFGIENSLKAFKGYNSGLLDKALMAKKAAERSQCGRRSLRSRKKSRVRRPLVGNRQQSHGRAKSRFISP